MGARRPVAVLHLRSRRRPERVSRRRSTATCTQIDRRRDRASAASRASSPALSVASQSGRGGVHASTTAASTTSTRCASTAPRGIAKPRAAHGSTPAATLPPLERTAERGRRAARRRRRSGCRRAAGVRGRGVQREARSSKAWGSRPSPSAPSRFGAAIGGGIGALLQRHARRSDAGRRLPDQLRLGGSFSVKDIGAQVVYINQTQPLELGPGRRPGAVPERRLSSSARRLSTASRVYIEETIIFRQTERSAVGRRRVSVQPRAARRVPGRRQPDLVRSDRPHAGVLAEHGAADLRRHARRCRSARR